MRLFWKQYLSQVNDFKENTHVTKELFIFLTKLMNETKVAQYLDVIFDPIEYVQVMVQYIRNRPILESGNSI